MKIIVAGVQLIVHIMTEIGVIGDNSDFVKRYLI